METPILVPKSTQGLEVELGSNEAVRLQRPWTNPPFGFLKKYRDQGSQTAPGLPKFSWFHSTLGLGGGCKDPDSALAQGEDSHGQDLQLTLQAVTAPGEAGIRRGARGLRPPVVGFLQENHGVL